MLIKLLRRYRRDYTSGVFSLNGNTFYTIERPWIPSPHHRGGMNKESCVPEGVYDLRPYSSEKFPNVWYLSNPNLDVYLDIPAEQGRSRILMHSGNMAADVIGCIAVGLGRASDGRIVLKSRAAIDLMRGFLQSGRHHIEIGAIHESSADDLSSKDPSADHPTPV